MKRKIAFTASFLVAIVLALVQGLPSTAMQWFHSVAFPPPDDEILKRETSGGAFKLQFVSRSYMLDQVYGSMQGPSGNHPAIGLMPDRPADETVWLTGIETQVVDAQNQQPISNEYFCHSNLTLNPEASSPEKHNKFFATPTHAEWRFFTLVPGRMSVRLPEGFGIPIRCGTPIDYFTMSLNQNPGHPQRAVRMQTTLSGRSNDGPGRAPRPLFRRAVYIYQQHEPLKKKPVPAAKNSGTHEGELCAEDCKTQQTGRTPSRALVVESPKPPAPSTLPTPAPKPPAHPGETCCVENASRDGVLMRFGRQNTVHWMVPPGKHIYRTEVSEQLELPFDTSVHYVTGHLHPFGKNMRLVDMQSGATLFEIKAECFNDRLGVAQMSEISSREGVRLSKAGRYELLAEYENTQDKPIDAMAILYLYALDEPPGQQQR